MLLLVVLFLSGIVADHDSPRSHGGGLSFGDLVPKHPTQTGGNDQGRTGMTGDSDRTSAQQRYRESVASRFRKLSKDQQDALFRNPDQLARKGKDFLNMLPPDILGDLPPDTLKHISGQQLGNAVPHLRNLSEFGLNNLLHGVNRTAFSMALKKMKERSNDFSKAQARSTVQRLVDSIGDVNSWNSSDFDDLGGLRKGLTCQQTSSMWRVAFDNDSIAKGFRDDAMKGKLDRNQRKGLVESKKRQKQPTNWERADLTQIGPMLGEVGNHDLKQMRNSTVRDAMRGILGNQNWNDGQSRTLIKKYQSGTGRNLPKMTSTDMADLGTLRNKLGTEQNRQLQNGTFKNVAEYVGKMGNPRSGTTQTTARRYFGNELGRRSDGRPDTSKMKSMHLTKTPKLITGLSKMQLRNISRDEVRKSINGTSPFVGNLNTHQAKIIIDKAKRNGSHRRQWSADQIRSWGNYMSGFQSRDVDEMNDTRVAKAVVDGLKNHVSNALPSMQRKLAQKTQSGGQKRPSKMGSDLSQHVSLRQMRTLSDSDTIDDKDSRGASFKRHQVSQMFDRFKRANNLGEPDSLDMNNRTKWTAQTIRDHVGGLLSGASADDLKKLPIDNILDAMTTLGQHGYTHKQGQTMVDSYRMQLMPNFTAFDSSDVSNLGPMVDHLYGRDLDALRKGANGRNNTKQVVCQLRNKDLSRNGPQKRNDLFNRGREALSDNSRSRRAMDELSADTVDKLGSLMGGIDSRDVSSISDEALRTKMRDFSKHFNGTQSKALADHVVNRLGKRNASMLTGDHLSDMGRAIHNLFDGQLRALNPSAVGDAMDDLRERNWTHSQAKIMLGHAMKHFNKNVSQWNGYHFRRVKNMNIGHDPDVFHNMSADALDDALDSLPSQRMDDDQQRALRTAVKQKLGGNSESGVSEDHLAQLGAAANGDKKFLGRNTHFADSERSIDVLGHNGGQGMDKETAQAGFQTIKQKRSSRQGNNNVDSVGMSNMGEFITGASTTDVDGMNARDVADALPRLGQNHYQNMDTNAFNPLRQKASQGMSTDGRTPKPASQWSAGEAGERGTLVGSEDTQHYQSKHVQALSSHTFMNMRTDAAKGIPAESYREMGSDNARVMQERSDFSQLDSSQQQAISAAAMQDTLYAPDGSTSTDAPPTFFVTQRSSGSKVGVAGLLVSLLVVVIGFF